MTDIFYKEAQYMLMDDIEALCHRVQRDEEFYYLDEVNSIVHRYHSKIVDRIREELDEKTFKQHLRDILNASN